VGLEEGVFERVLALCIEAGLVGGEGLAIDASLIEADANTPTTFLEVAIPEICLRSGPRTPA
jgi:transposase